MSAPMKFSFGFKKTNKGPTVLQVSDKVKGEENVKTEERVKEMVHAIDGNQIHGDGALEKSKQPKEYVIPCIKINQYNIKRPGSEDEDDKDSKDNIKHVKVNDADNNKLDKHLKTDVKDEIKEEIKTEVKSEATEEVVEKPKEESLVERAKRELIEEGRSGKVSTPKGESDAWRSMIVNRPPTEYESDRKLNTSIRPPEPTLESYEAIPVSHFGAAMLRGMGWKEGEPIGGINKAVTKVFEPKERLRGLGLGAEAALRKQQAKEKQAEKEKQQDKDRGKNGQSSSSSSSSSKYGLIRK